MLVAGFAGHNSKAGDLLSLRLDKASGGAALPSTGTTKIHHALEYDAVLQINDTGVALLE